MVVKVEEIREQGLNLQQPIPQATLAQAMGEGPDTLFRPAGDTQLDVSFNRVGGGGVLVRGSMEVPVVALCKRCLAEVPLKVPVQFTLNLVPEVSPRRASDDDDAAVERAGTFGWEDADREPFDGKRIDLDPIIREQVLLALPMDVVCREDCQGLCAACGQNLNEAGCGCKPQNIDPRLAALKNIKIN